MLWGLPPETWLELWSGAIGAFVSAIAAALVAWGVVSATNKHQAKLAYVSAMQAKTEAQRSRAIEAVAEFLKIIDDAHSNIDSLSAEDFRPSHRRHWALVHTLGLIGGPGMQIRNLLFMWPAMIRELVCQAIDTKDAELREETLKALGNVHSAFAVTMPSFIGDEPFDITAMMQILEEAYALGQEVLTDTSRL